MTPAICIFSLFSSVFVTALFFERAFYTLTAVLTFIMEYWVASLALMSLIGARRLRQESLKDWHPLLEQLMEADPDVNDVLHIVLLPNYKENEGMLKETLDTIGQSPLARSRVRVVLAMEAREGTSGREKAERLIRDTQHLFADIFATYHPENLPGEVAGKSSNTQWAFREALRHYGPILLGCDLSRVFLTVGDADTLWHPQYFSALTYSGLTMSHHERSWRIWQPPVLLLRNIFTVPALTRASAHATLIFELSALACQVVFPAFAYSAYSTTLALASHPEVDGWDVDVIAEDHHMFCKCYFAALWELAHARKDATKTKEEREAIAVRPQLKVEPIFLPAVSYLVESSDGYWASLRARFDQARRHSQGVVELGYVLLQYARLTANTGFFSLPFRTHVAISSIAIKIHTLHITATAQATALILTMATKLIPAIKNWVLAGGISALLSSASITGITGQAFDGFSALDSPLRALISSLCQISVVMVLYTFTAYLVVKDLVEGRYYQVLGSPSRNMAPVEEETDEHSCHSEDDSASSANASSSVQAPPRPTCVRGKMSTISAISLFVSIANDTSAVGYPAIFCFAVIPVCMAAWSLFRRGTDFEYIVGEKPE